MNTPEHGPCNDNNQREAAKPQAAEKNGRFMPGNPGGPGNPYARRVAELRRVMLECVTPQEMEIIVGELMVQAKCGNLAAIKLLFQYVIGKPPAAVDPDTLDLQEVEQYRRAPEPETLREIVAARMPADLACDLLRGVLPYVGRSEANYLAEGLLNAAAEADRGGEEAAEPGGAAGRSVPSPNGNSGADATRRRTRPAPAATGNHTPPRREERAAPCRPSGG